MDLDLCIHGLCKINVFLLIVLKYFIVYVSVTHCPYFIPDTIEFWYV